jgi:hypothetical protein
MVSRSAVWKNEAIVGAGVGKCRMVSRSAVWKNEAIVGAGVGKCRMVSRSRFGKTKPPLGAGVGKCRVVSRSNRRIQNEASLRRGREERRQMSKQPVEEASPERAWQDKKSHSVEWGDPADEPAPGSKITYELMWAALEFRELTETARDVSLNGQ